MSARMRDQTQGRRAFRQKGFTLVEVLVAMAVIAVGLAALISEAGRTTRLATELKLRTYAGWVASNALSEIRLEPGWVDTGSRRGEELQANKRWYWRAEISTTEDENLRRIDVYVSDSSDEDDGSLVLLSGFEARQSARQSAKTDQR